MSRPARRTGRRLLVGVGIGLGLAWPVRAQPGGAAARVAHAGQGPTLVVEGRDVGPAFLGARELIAVRGVLRNAGPERAGLARLAVTAVDAAGRAIGTGHGEAMVDVLDVDEAAPFEVLLGACCAPDVADVAITATVPATTADRYRGLRVIDVARWAEGEDGVLTGRLVNVGDGFAAAPATRLHLGRWRGGRLVGLTTATLPIDYGSGPEGQGHAPGASYPWLARLPLAPGERLETWVRADLQPDGSFPVPASATGVARTDGGTAPRLRLDVMACGAERLTAGWIVVEAVVTERVRAAAAGPPPPPGAVLGFARADFTLPTALSAGATTRLELTLPDFDWPAEVVTGEAFTARVMAADRQAARPASLPCAPWWPPFRLALPLAARAEAAPGR